MYFHHYLPNIRLQKKKFSWQHFKKISQTLPSVFKIAKAIPIHKNNQKLIIETVDQYPSYLILKRLLKNSCTKGYLIF